MNINVNDIDNPRCDLIPAMDIIQNELGSRCIFSTSTFSIFKMFSLCNKHSCDLFVSFLLQMRTNAYEILVVLIQCVLTLEKATSACATEDTSKLAVSAGVSCTFLLSEQ